MTLKPSWWPESTQDLLGRLRRAASQLRVPVPPTSGVHVVDWGGVRLALDLSQPTHRGIYRRGEFEPDVVEAMLSTVMAGDVVFDIGANFGVHSTHLAVRRPDVQAIYAFEPGSVAFALLERSLEASGVTSSVVARKLAIGRSRGEATLKQFGGLDTPYASLFALADLDYVEEVVEIRALDELVPTLEAAPAVIKCDVEGGEMDVLLGAEKLLAGEYGPPPVWFLEANYETAGMAGYFPWDLIEVAGKASSYRGYFIRNGGVCEMPHARALRHGDTLVLAIPEIHGPRIHGAK